MTVAALLDASSLAALLWVAVELRRATRDVRLLVAEVRAARDLWRADDTASPSPVSQIHTPAKARGNTA